MDADGCVTAEFIAKLRGLDAKNSQHELSIEKFLTKSEEAFFDKVKEDQGGQTLECGKFSPVGISPSLVYLSKLLRLVTRRE